MAFGRTYSSYRGQHTAWRRPCGCIRPSPVMAMPRGMTSFRSAMPQMRAEGCLCLVSSICACACANFDEQRNQRPAIHCADLRSHVAQETWTQQIERIQRSALEKAVSVVNRMISSAERDPNVHGVDALPNASNDLDYDGEYNLREDVKLHIKAKTSVLQAVTVRKPHEQRNASACVASRQPSATAIPQESLLLNGHAMAYTKHCTEELA